MTILQLIQKPQLRGAEIFASQLSGHLQQMGHKIYLVSLFPGNASLPFGGAKICLNRPVGRRFFDFKGWHLLAQLVKEKNPDIIQCNAGDTLKFAVFSKLVFGWKTPIVARNASIVSAYIKSLPVKWLNHYLYRKAAAIISVSELSKKDLLALFPGTNTKMSVIPVGIEKHQFAEVEWKGGKDALVHIIHVGGFTFEKNHKGILNIFRKLLRSHPQTHLHLLGNGPLKKEIEDQVNEEGLQNHLSFYGFASDPVNYIKKADVLVLPSHIEGLPAVILEAQYCKTPVIAYNVGGISEVIQNQKTGYLVEKDQEEAFVAAIMQILNTRNEEAINLITEMAYDQVMSRFDNHKIAEQFLDVYKQLLLY